jgi:endonuclease YncB( thermonuclease family)
VPALGQESCRAIEGDMIRCGAERIRLHGIFTPEINEPGGVAARELLQRRLDSGQVRIERLGVDGYGRTLGNVYIGRARITQGDVGPIGARGVRR